MNLQTLIFDVDGTLADTERDGHRPAFNAAFAEAGLAWYWDVPLYGQLLAVTGGKERIAHYAQRHDPKTAARPGFADLVKQLHRAKTRHYLQALEGGAIPLRPGVASLLHEARSAGMRLAIATTTTLENVTTLLTTSLAPDAPEWFEVIGAGDVVAAKKPAADIYRHVLGKLDVPAHRCLAIEDSRNGLEASLGARIPTVITVNEYTYSQDFKEALALLPNLVGVSLATLQRWHRQTSFD